MNFLKYRDAALETASYPGRGDSVGVIYLSMKLAGEAGELVEKIREGIHSGDLNVLGIVAELGDVQWYCAAISDELDFDPTFDYERDTCINCVTQGIMLNATRFSEQLAKGMRDDGYGTLVDTLDGARRTLLIGYINQILAGIDNAAYLLGGNLDAVGEYNIEKITSRYQRGVLGGNGDNR